MLNRWQVYEWLKQSFMYSGRVPSFEEVAQKFPGCPPEEITEGVVEFVLVTKIAVKKGA